MAILPLSGVDVRPFLLSVLFSSSFCLAQSPSSTPVQLALDSPELHLTKKTEPIYPPIAMAARVSGKVVLNVEIRADGSVAREKIVSGPPMLWGAASDAVKQWVYSPILRDGHAVGATFPVAVNFVPVPAPPHDEQVAANFFYFEKDCLKAFSSHADAAKTVVPCEKAAELAAFFPPTERFIERRTAYVYASTAYLRNNQPTEALEYADKALAVVAQGHDDSSGTSAAWSVHAQAEAVKGDLAKASDDLTKAEDSEQIAIKEMGGLNNDLVKQQYVPTLKGLLNFHAKVLNALGHKDEAQAKTDEAAKL